MVSPTVSKTPPLSYAERAKKATNIKSPISTRSLINTQPPAPTTSDVTNITSATANSFSSTVSLKQPESPSTSNTGSTSVGPNQKVPQKPDQNANEAALFNGTAGSSKDISPIAIAATSTVTQAAPSKAVENVWTRRKEQMAQQLQASRPSASTQTSPPVSKNTLRPTPHPTPLVPPSVISPQASTSSSSLTNSSDDPFVVRIPNQASSAPPPVDDVESWPEVGKSHLPQVSAISIADVDKDEEAGSTKEQGNMEQSHISTTPRKSEKTKWVPIPPEELQAAADAALQSAKRSSRSHSRSKSQQNGHSGSKQSTSGIQRSTANSQTGSNAGSVSVSQAPSRPQSGRNSTAQSVSQSRIQSRASSAQSSPRHSRGRRLPPDEALTTPPGFGSLPVSAPRQSSGTNSPQPGMYVDASFSGGPLPILGPSPTTGQMPFYPHGPTQQAPSLQPNSNQQPPQGLRHSPLSTPYVIPPLPPRYQMNHSPVPIPPSSQPAYPIAPGYQMYPYALPDYSSGPNPGQPYVYWNGPGYTLPPGQQSPPYPPVMHYPHGPPPLQQPHPEHYMISHHQHDVNIVSPGGDVPPPTMVDRPPPPEASEAVAGYRAVGLVQVGRGQEVCERPVVFGSVGIPGSSNCPSPAPPLLSSHENKDEPKVVEVLEKSFTTFAIGVSPGESTPSRLRSRARSIRDRSKAEAADAGSDVRGPSAEGGKEDDCTDGVMNVTVKLIDLTDQQPKWQFGTTGSLHGTSTPPSEVQSGGIAQSSLTLAPSMPVDVMNLVDPDEAHPLAATSVSTPSVPVVDPQYPQHTYGTPVTLQEGQLGAQGVQGTGDEWEVQDFGYGFGSASGTGYATAIDKEERMVREREREREREQERERLREIERDERDRQRDVDDRNRERMRDFDFPIRARRGGFGYNFGRRGRAGLVGFGRGFHRNMNRGSFHVPPPARQQPPFTVTPPPQFQSIVSVSDASSNGYYPPNHQYSQQTAVPSYVPSAYDSYQPHVTVPPASGAPQTIAPVPVPLTNISFPLDSTRYYLLGQVEYYLSPQNMAQDFYLRQQMDSRGWIPISLIASFNRVRRLTMDAQLVKDVLTLSSVVQVKEDWVRMEGWERFVLPDATRSTIGEFHETVGVGSGQMEYQTIDVSHTGETEDVEGDFDGDLEEDDDEDVVFVLDHEAQSWSPDRSHV